MPFQPDPTSDTSTDEPPFYGWRYRRVTLPDGTEDLIELPLTLRDVLHPKENDHIPENTLHSWDRASLTMWLLTRVARVRRGLLLTGCIVNWGVRGIRNRCPDLTLIQGIRVQPSADFGTYYFARYGGRCALALEIVSPHTRVNDVRHKFAHYYRAGVQQYVLIDQQRELGPREVIGYRRSSSGFVRMRPDREGRVRIKSLGVLLGLADPYAVLYDDQTGERLPTYEEVTREYEEKVRLREEAERLVQQRLDAIHAAERLAQQRLDATHAIERRCQELEREIRRLRGEPL